MHLIIGLGKTGLSIAQYLRQRNQAFVMFDTRLQPPGLSEFNEKFPEVDVFLNEFPEELYQKITEIICSPGIPLETPVLQKAASLGLPIIGDIECLAREITAPVIAITGTNGKSTVTTLVGEMAKAAGLKVAVAGNIGLPVLSLLDDAIPYDLWVLELSSFQLDLTYSLAPLAATILNITPDHLDRHHHIDAYIEAKQRVYRQAQVALHNRDDALTFPKEMDGIFSPQMISYGLNPPVSGNWGLRPIDGINFLSNGVLNLLSVDALRIKGRHNWQNALAACALAEAVNIDYSYMIQTLRTFTGLPHRSQWVRTLDSVDWINDSKGTNIGATMSAISGIGGSMNGKIVLIAGGQGKGADFTELRSPISEYVRSMILIGEDADKLNHALADVVPIVKASNLEAAVNVAKSHAKPGDVVLLSPACASLDMFRDFNHRGDSFTAAVNAL